MNLKILFYHAFAVFLLLLGSRILAQDPSVVGPITTVITESQWIGVNTEGLTGKAHVGTIGVNTEFLSEEAGQTKWIGKNTQYITDVVETATVSGALSTITSFPAIQIVGPVNDQGLPIGSFDVIITPALKAQIQQVAEEFCSVDQNMVGSCTAEFSYRTQTILKSGIGILTERGITPFDEGVVWFFANLAFEYEELYNRQREIVLIVHIGNDFPSSTPYTTVASTYVTTLVAMPKPTSGLDTAFPPKLGLGDDDNEDDEDSCWLYVGIDGGDLSEDDLSEISDQEEPGETDTGSVTKRQSSTDNVQHNNEEHAKYESRPRHGVAGRIAIAPLMSHPLAKRATDKITRIGKCSTEPTGTIVRAKPHPRATDVMKPFDISRSNTKIYGLDPKLWWFIPKQAPGDVNDACVIASLTKAGKRVENDDVSKANYPLPYDQLRDETTLSVDHIYERSLLQDFFESELSSLDDPRCATFVSMFDKTDTGLSKEKGSHTRFWSLWQQISNPSPGNWAFAGVDWRINNLKGNMLNPGLGGWPAQKPVSGPNAHENFDKLFQLWNNAQVDEFPRVRHPDILANSYSGLSMDFLNNPDVAAYFSQRNKAIYNAFRDFDKIQKCERDPKDQTIPTNWAEAYKNFMIGLLTTNEALIQTKITDVMNAIEEQEEMRVKFEKPDQPNKWGKAYLSLQSIFPVSHFKINQGALLDFSEQNLGIRDDAAEDCPVSLPEPACVERTIVDCIYQYKDRPDLSAADCPPIPPLPATCTGGSSTPDAVDPALIRRCVPIDNPKACFLSISFNLPDGPPKYVEGNDAYIYDNNCNELGKSMNIKPGTSITSSLPYTVEIVDFFDVFTFKYAGTVKEVTETRSDCIHDDQTSQAYRDHPNPVWRCLFDC